MDDDAPKPNAVWNAGDLGCGELLLKLRFKMRELGPAHVLQLTALDPGAPEDLPAWCRLTGHILIKFERPVYWIQKRPEN